MRGWLYFFFLLLSLRHGYTLYYTIPSGRGSMIKKNKYTLCGSGTRVIHRKLPLAGLADSFGDVWRRAFDEEVEHHRGGSGETVPVGVIWGGVLYGRGQRGGGQKTEGEGRRQMYVPSNNVLHMAVLNIHLSGPRNRDPTGTVPHGHDEVRVYRSLAPLSSGEEEEEGEW